MALCSCHAWSQGAEDKSQQLPYLTTMPWTIHHCPTPPTTLLTLPSRPCGHFSFQPLL